MPTHQTTVLGQEDTLKAHDWHVLSILYSTVTVNVCLRVSLLKTAPVCVLTLSPHKKSPKRDLETFNSFYRSCISKGEDSNSNRICLRWTHNSPDLPCTRDSVLASVWTDEELQPLPETCIELLTSQLAMSASPLGFSYFSNRLMLHRCSFSSPLSLLFRGFKVVNVLPVNDLSEDWKALLLIFMCTKASLLPFFHYFGFSEPKLKFSLQVGFLENP